MSQDPNQQPLPQITIWYNDQKGNPKWPFFTGKITFPDGTVHNVQLWTNVSTSGNTYYRGNLKPFEPKPTPVPEPSPVPQSTPSQAKEIPNWNVPASGLFGPQQPQQEIDESRERAKILLEKAFIEKFEKTPVDQLTPGDYEHYNHLRAKHKINDYYGK
jgi:hypothetical protein